LNWLDSSAFQRQVAFTGGAAVLQESKAVSWLNSGVDVEHSTVGKKKVSIVLQRPSSSAPHIEKRPRSSSGSGQGERGRAPVREAPHEPKVQEPRLELPRGDVEWVQHAGAGNPGLPARGQLARPLAEEARPLELAESDGGGGRLRTIRPECKMAGVPSLRCLLWKRLWTALATLLALSCLLLLGGLSLDPAGGGPRLLAGPPQGDDRCPQLQLGPRAHDEEEDFRCLGECGEFGPLLVI
jgi:hypothetical protein